MLVETLLARGPEGLLPPSLVPPVSPISPRSHQGSLIPEWPWLGGGPLCGPGWLAGAARPAEQDAGHKPGVAGVGTRVRSRSLEVEAGGWESRGAAQGLWDGMFSECTLLSPLPHEVRVLNPPFHREGVCLRAHSQGALEEAEWIFDNWPLSSHLPAPSPCNPCFRLGICVVWDADSMQGAG